MLDKDCYHDCHQSHCPFAQDTRNPNRYVCLKCGVEREIDRSYPSLGSIFLLILLLFLSLQLLGITEKQDKKQQQQQSACKLPHQKIAYQQQSHRC